MFEQSACSTPKAPRFNFLQSQPAYWLLASSYGSMKTTPNPQGSRYPNLKYPPKNTSTMSNIETLNTPYLDTLNPCKQKLGQRDLEAHATRGQSWTGPLERRYNPDLGLARSSVEGQR